MSTFLNTTPTPAQKQKCYEFVVGLVKTALVGEEADWEEYTREERYPLMDVLDFARREGLLAGQP